MNFTDALNQKIAKLTFASMYTIYVKKVESKGRPKEELHQLTDWLTRFDDKELQELTNEKVTFESSFSVPHLNLNASLYALTIRSPLHNLLCYVNTYAINI